MADTNAALTPTPTQKVSDVITTSPRMSRRRKQCLNAMGFFLIIAVILSFSISVLVTRWMLPVTVTFDLNNTIEQYQQQMAQQFTAESPLSEAQIRDATQRFYAALSSSLAEYQHAHRAVILVSPAVVMGAQDITGEVQQAIARKMAKEEAK